MIQPRHYTAPSINTPRASAEALVDMCWYLSLVISIFVAGSLFPDAAYAQAVTFANDPLQFSFGAVRDALIGRTGKSVATLSIAALGMGALMGKISKERAIVLAVGISLIFGGANLIAAFGINRTNGTSGNAALAANGTGILRALTTILNTITGRTGVVIATVGLIVLGIGAMFGKISYPMALIVAVGISLIFGAATIVRILGGTAAGGFTTGSNVFETAFNQVIFIMNGPAGLAFATLAVVTVGIGALYGKISYAQALFVVIGTVLLFGGATIVGQLNTGNTTTVTAANGMTVAQAFNNIITTITGPTGTALATIAIGVMGIGALMGKISYPTALVFATGIGLVFGSTAIIASFSVAGTAVSPVNDSVGNAFLQIVSIMRGATGIALATIAVIILGIGAFFGKVSVPAALILVVGIVLIFGSVNIVTLVTTGAPTNCATYGSTDAVGKIMDNLLNVLTGNSVRALAAVAVIMLGVGALMGKINYPLALIVVTGIALVFGAAAILDTIATGNTIAGGGTGLQGLLCNLLNVLTGTAGKSIACIAIIMLGIAAMVGKASFPAALTIVLGIGIMFGAAPIVTKLVPGAGAICTVVPGGLPARSSTGCI
jgi:type IV secretory pathway VirB2 component (pilin)